jgi:hypothetical protein
MSKFQVELIARTFYTIEVEAESREDAVDAAYTQALTNDDKDGFYLVVDQAVAVEAGKQEFRELVTTARTAQQYGLSNDDEIDNLWAAVEQAEALLALLG